MKLTKPQIQVERERISNTRIVMDLATLVGGAATGATGNPCYIATPLVVSAVADAATGFYVEYNLVESTGKGINDTLRRIGSGAMGAILNVDRSVLTTLVGALGYFIGNNI